MIRSHVQNLLEPSWWSLCIAIGLVGLVVNFVHIFRIGIIPWMMLLCCVLIGYFWRRDVVREGSILGSHTGILSTSILNAMLLFVFSEIIFFSGFFCAIFYSIYSREVSEINMLRVNCLDPLGVPLLNTVLLLSSRVSATYAHELRLFGSGDFIYVIFSIILRLLFFWYQYVEFSCSDFGIADGIFGSCFFSLTGFHGFHVVVGLCLLLLPLSRLLLGNSYFGKFAGLECSMIYWHFVDVIWLVVMAVVYIGPWLM